jgi:hypothetical protein
MPLSDWPQTSAAQLAQPAFKLTADQIQAAVDGAAITDQYAASYWAATLDIAILEATAGITLSQIAQGLVAGYSSQDPDAMRSIKYLPDPDVNVNKFISINVEAAEAKLGITLLQLRAAIDAAA